MERLRYLYSLWFNNYDKRWYKNGYVLVKIIKKNYVKDGFVNC